MRRANFLAALIRTAYLPEEIPPVITTRFFADYCRDKFTSLDSRLKDLLKLSTKFDTFTAPRTEMGRRNLAIVHPLGQLAVSLILTRHRSAIKKFVGRSETTFYRVTTNRKKDRAFEGLDFQEWDVAKRKLYSDFEFVLRADISRFFYTFYTHSIPWAVLGKEKAKDWHFKHRSKLNAHWSSELDRALQTCQSRETFGIPVGPDTSRIIAEILMAGLELSPDLSSVMRRGKSIRLVDDFLIGFDYESLAWSALGRLRAALWKFNLQLNDGKTNVLRSRSIFEERWKLELASIELSETDTTQQSRDIHRLVDVALRFCAETGSASPATFACVRLAAIENTADNFEIIIEALIRLARDFPASIRHVCAFFINNQRECKDPKRYQIVKKGLRRLLRLHCKQGHDLEVAWCLLVASVLRIELDKEDLPNDNTTPSSIVFAILGLMREQGILGVPLSRWPWRRQFKVQGVFSENWLPYYEAVRRKWTSDKTMISAVKKHPVLSEMLSAHVTFLDDFAINAGEIDLSRRLLRRVRRPTHTWSGLRIILGEYSQSRLMTDRALVDQVLNVPGRRAE